MLREQDIVFCDAPWSTGRNQPQGTPRHQDFRQAARIAQMRRDLVTVEAHRHAEAVVALHELCAARRRDQHGTLPSHGR